MDICAFLRFCALLLASKWVCTIRVSPLHKGEYLLEKVCGNSCHMRIQRMHREIGWELHHSCQNQYTQENSIFKFDLRIAAVLGVRSWSPFVTRKSGHISRIWAEMTQALMPKLTKSSPNSLARVQFRQNSPKFAKFPQKFAKLAKFRFTKGL